MNFTVRITNCARFACSMESAALHHPHANIYVIVASPILEDEFMVRLTDAYKNIKVRHLDVAQFLSGNKVRSADTK